MKNGRLRRILLALILSSSWLLSGWPQVWHSPRIPPKITQAEAATATYYFNAWDSANPGAWDTTGDYIVDGNLTTYGRDNDNGSYADLNGNDCPGTNLGTITGVTIGLYWSNNTTLANVKGRLAPYFGGSSVGDNHDATVDPSAEGSPIWEDFSIYSDTNAPSPWTWSDVQNLDTRLTVVRGTTGRVNAYSVRIIVTYTDNLAPTPDPMTFSSAPSNDSASQVSMTATTATDVTTPPVNYLFTNDNSSCGASAGTGGTSSSWQASASYSDSGLQPNQCYGYTVTAQDSVTPTPNTGTASSISSAYTSANTPGTPTLGSATLTTLALTNDANSNPSSNPTTNFAVQVVTTSPSDSNWLNKWVDANGDPSATEVWQTDAALDALVLDGLRAGTTYGVKVKARNQDNDETSLSAEGQGATTAPTISVSIGDGEVIYGMLGKGANQNTTSSGLDDTQTATNNGDVPENFSIKGQDSADWALMATAGNEQYVHEFCKAGSGSPDPCDTGPSWVALDTDYQPLVTGVAVSGTQKFDLKITLPTETAANNQQWVDVTVLAVQQ